MYESDTRGYQVGSEIAEPKWSRLGCVDPSEVNSGKRGLALGWKGVARTRRCCDMKCSHDDM